MASYTMQVLSNEISAEYYRHYYTSSSGVHGDTTKDGSFSFSVPNLTGATIQAVSITAPVIKTEEQGGYGEFSLKVGNSNVGNWEDSKITTWEANGLSIAGSSSMTITLTLNHALKTHAEKNWAGSWDGYTGRKLGQATATITYSIDNPIAPTSPDKGTKFNRNQNVQCRWNNALIGSTVSVLSQYLYWKYSNESNYRSVDVGKDAKSYTFDAGTFVGGTVQWFIKVYDQNYNVYDSDAFNFIITDNFTVKATSPAKGAKLKRSQRIECRWSYSITDPSIVSINSVYLYWKYSTEGSYRTITIPKEDTSYFFESGVFNEGTINWYVGVADTRGNSYKTEVFDFIIANDISVKATSPADDASFLRSNNITFRWSNSGIDSDVPVASQKIYWKYSTDTSYKSISVGKSDTSYTVNAGMFTGGTITWYVSSTDTYGYTVNSNSLRFKVSNDFSVTAQYPLNGNRIPASSPTTFTWTNSLLGSTTLGVKSQYICWKYFYETSYNKIDVGNKATSYTFPAFNTWAVDWYVESTDNQDYTVKSAVQEIFIGIQPTVEISFPKDVNIRNSLEQVFTWELIEEVPTGQVAYEIGYKKHGDPETAWTHITGRSNSYHVFPANTFSTGQYDWRVQVTNKDLMVTEFAEATFMAIGETDMPKITSVTNSSIPSINWSITSQDTFEVEIFSKNEKIYQSGIQVGNGVRTFKPNLMLEDGNYIIKMRAMNEFGFFTKWAEKAFILAPQKPLPVECRVYANGLHGVNITKGSGTAQTLYVIRREFGKTGWTILGKLPSGGTFTDNTLITNRKYEYALRNYNPNAGYADSNVVSMTLNYQGVIIYNGNKFVKLFKTEEEQFNVIHAPSKSYSYSHAIGRKYPVREASEWISHIVSLSCFVVFDEYEMLEKFYEGNDPLWYKDDNFSYKCSIDSIQIKETLLGRGYTINIDLSRTDEEEVNLNA